MAWIIVFIVIAAIVGLVFGNQKGAHKKKGERGPIKGTRILTMNEQPTFLK